MSDPAIPATFQKRKNLFKTILLTGLLAGALDATAASIQFLIRHNGDTPLKVWRFVASGIFGKAVMQKNIWEAAAWGLLFHFIIAFSFTTFFFFIYPKIKWLSKNSIVTGLLYGIFVWAVMNLIVVPLSNTPKFPFNVKQSMIAAAILIAAIGLPISLLAKKYYSSKK